MSIQKPAISINNLRKTYRLYDSRFDRVREAFHPFRKMYHRPYHALNDITLTVQKGEFVGIIGRNGSGKSTLLQLISGVLEPSSGIIETKGSISALLELGAGFNPEFTGRENVFMNGSLMGLGRYEVEKRMPQIEEFADIGSFIDQPVKTYSSGMFVRLAFAVAISVKPEILIVDEALAVGDIFFQQKCINYMQEEMATCTKVLVTHDLHAAMNLCEKLYVLEKGCLIYEGPSIQGIELYTKMMQDEMFSHNEETVIPDLNDQKAVPNTINTDGWIDVLDESKAGAGDIVIDRVRLSSAATYEAINTAVAGDLLLLEMQLQVVKKSPSILFGYLIKDRVGNSICGDNSLSLDSLTFNLEPGSHLVKIHLNWPDIAPDDYFITLGIGQGNHPLHHVIQCWAHNVVLIKSLNKREAVHGIFTNPMNKCEVISIGKR